MKVKEFIEFLKHLDDEAEVIFKLPVGCCGEYEELEYNEYYDDTPGYIEIYFDNLDILDSCRKYGAARRVQTNFIKGE